MCKKSKNVGRNIIRCLGNPKTWQIISAVVAIAALVYTADQVRVARSDLEVSKSSLEVARSNLEAITRPYLSLEGIQVEDRGEKWISIVVTVINRGDLPAMGVNLSQLVMGGDELAWTSNFDEDYPSKTYTTSDGVIITTGGIIIPPQRSNFPNDIIFFPDKINTIEVPTHRTTWKSTIVEGISMDIGLTYSWGGKDYWYVATAMLMSNGEWSVKLERGN